MCGWYNRDITPSLPVTLAGFGGKQASRIDDPLEANAIAVRRDGEPFIFVSSDVLFISNDVRSRVLEQVRKVETAAEENLFWGATHTHSAPAVDEVKKGLGEVESDYLESFIEETAGLLTGLLKPVQASRYGSPM